jgi:hypothetical protein
LARTSVSFWSVLNGLKRPGVCVIGKQLPSVIGFNFEENEKRQSFR